MLKLGVPSKGRLQNATISWFSERGIEISRSALGREYRGSISLPGAEIVMISAAEVPRELAAGRLHLGVTGQDLVQEEIPQWTEQLLEIEKLGFGHADLVVAVPSFWIDVNTMADFDGAAAAFRRTHGHRLRVATKYQYLVRSYFQSHGVADYQLVDSQGATEGTVKNLTAEAIADITSTGSTLRDNHLKVLDDGPILKSQATLFLSRHASWTRDTLATLHEVCRRIGASTPDIDV
ncbi:MAG: ATP phosphoribosyltransferase [Pseudomonadota bacterium]